jgi:hypothetical protein
VPCCVKCCVRHALLTYAACCLSSRADIRPGQGLYYETLSQSWRAKNCNSNTYGVDKVTYGLSTFPCRPCPANMVASTNRTGYPNSWSYFVSDAATGTEGFTSPMACVNQAGEFHVLHIYFYIYHIYCVIPWFLQGSEFGSLNPEPWVYLSSCRFLQSVTDTTCIFDLAR